MSTNKIMALIGNILNTISTVLAIIASLFLALVAVSVSSYTGTDGSGGQINIEAAQTSLTAVFIALAVGLILSTVACVFAWVAFAKMDKPNSKGWKIYLLVLGILTVFNFFAGVFYILAFALKQNQPIATGGGTSTSPIEAEIAEDSAWTQITPQSKKSVD